MTLEEAIQQRDDARELLRRIDFAFQTDGTPHGKSTACECPHCDAESEPLTALNEALRDVQRTRLMEAW